MGVGRSQRDLMRSGRQILEADRYRFLRFVENSIDRNHLNILRAQAEIQPLHQFIFRQNLVGLHGVVLDGGGAGAHKLLL